MIHLGVFRNEAKKRVLKNSYTPSGYAYVAIMVMLLISNIIGVKLVRYAVQTFAGGADSL